ncbi:unnamed protein product [Sphagnum tenellum]
MVRFAAQSSQLMQPVSKRFRTEDVDEEDVVCSSSLPLPPLSPHPTHVAEGARNNNGESYFSARFDPDVLDCNICLETLASPIFQCVNGHIACPSCCQKLSNVCPSCQKPVGIIRCLGLEKLIESLHITCKYAEYGCLQMPKFSLKKDHEVTCKHMPFTCLTGGGCAFVGQTDAFPEHFRDNHGFRTIKLDYGAWLTVTLFPKNDSFVLLKTEDELFVLCNGVQPLGAALHVMFFGDVAREDDFEYELSADKGKTKLKFAATARSVLQTDKQGSGFLVVPWMSEKNYIVLNVIIHRSRVCFR